MISKQCPTCKGKLIVREYMDETTGVIKWRARSDGDIDGGIENPCPDCQDSKGQPTGRICIFSIEDLEQLDFELVGQKDPRTEAIWSDVVEEMTFRKKG